MKKSHFLCIDLIFIIIEQIMSFLTVCNTEFLVTIISSQNL